MKIGTRLALGFSVIVLLIWATVFFAVNTYTGMGKEFAALEEDIVPGAMAMSEMIEKAQEIRAWTLVYSLRGNTVIMDKPVKEWLQENISSLERLAEEHREHETHIGLAEQKAAEELENKAKQLSSVVAEITNLKDQGMELDELKEKMKEFFALSFPPLVEQLEGHKAEYVEELAEAREAVYQAKSSGAQVLLLAAGLVTLGAFAVRLFAVRSIAKPLHALHRGTEIIGQGNLDYKVGTRAKGEIGQLSRAFDRMTEDLKSSFTSIGNLNKEITERKRAEEQLGLSEQNFRNSLDSSPLGALILTKRIEICYANKAVLDIYGYASIEELKTVPAKERYTPESYAKHHEREGKRKRGESVPSDYEISIMRKDGVVRHLEVFTRTILWDGERHAMRIYLDITEHKQAEEALRIAGQNFRNSLDNSPLGIRITGAKEDLLYANQAILDIYGYNSIEELKAAPVKQRYTPESYAELKERKRKRKQGEPIPSSYEIGIVRKDGEIRHLRMFYRKVIWNGKTRFQTLYLDITERKRAVLEIQEKNEQLDAQNEELQSQTEELITQQQELTEKNREVEEANRAKSEFFAHMSHELRTPLHSINGFTKLMLGDKVPDPDTRKEFLSIIDEQSVHLGGLIDNLLDMSRLESGGFKIQKQPVSIRDVLHYSVLSSYSLANEKGVVINEDVPAALPEVEVDEGRLKQVMLNLLGNAIKFTNEGSSITVKAEASDRELLVQVTDRGIGIPEEAMAHIFERFYQVKGTAMTGGDRSWPLYLKADY